MLEHCLQRYAQHGDETSRDTVMKLAQVFSAHATWSLTSRSVAYMFLTPKRAKFFSPLSMAS